MNPPQILCACQTWSSTIGNFITNFGVLDLHIQDFLESMVPVEEFSKLKKRSFHDRVEFIKKRLSEPSCNVMNKAKFAQFFQRLDPLRDTRNHIAHGVLRIGLGSDGKTLVHTLSLPRDLDGSNSEEARHLEFSELVAELTMLRELLDEFQGLAGFKTTGSVEISSEPRT